MPNDTFGATQVPTQYQSLVQMAAAKWGVPTGILAAQIEAESGYDPNAVSSAGAVGIAQFLPSTAKDWGVDPWNPASAIDGMAHLDSSYYGQFGSWDKALAAYNAGPGAVEQYGGVPPFAETQSYVAKILGNAGSDLAAGVGQIDQTVSITDQWGKLETLVTNIGSAGWWKRIGLGALGLGVLVGGVYFMLEKEPGSYRVARKIAGNVQ